MRRWGHKTGGLGVWALGEEGRKVLRSLSTTTRESSESCVEGVRDVVKRGSQTPVTITTEGAPGLSTAVAALGPKSLRMRCGVHQMQNLLQQVPPQAGPEFKAVVVARRDAPTVAAAERGRQALGAEYPLDFPEAWRCLWAAGKASLNPLQVPPRPPHYGRTSTLAERAFAEERRRTKVIPPLGDESGVGKLVFAVLIRVSEGWGKKAVREFEQLQIRSLRKRLQLDEHKVPSSEPATETQPRRSAASAA